MPSKFPPRKGKQHAFFMTDRQDQIVREIAEAEGEKISTLLREAIDLWIDSVLQSDPDDNV